MRLFGSALVAILACVGTLLALLGLDRWWNAPIDWRISEAAGGVEPVRPPRVRDDQITEIIGGDRLHADPHGADQIGDPQ